MPKKLLTVSLLVSGREDTTIKCLDSLKGLLENIDSELILVDTGCGEELRLKLETYTDQIVDFVWCNDFAKARNEGLLRAEGEWFLFLDDDEWFEDVTPVIRFFQSGEYKEYDQAVYKARNYSDYEGTRYTDEWVSRMIRLEKDTHFEGRVHESLVPAVGRCKKIDAFVHHYGYVFANEEEKQKHFQRNVQLLLKLIEEEPDNLRWRLQILQEYQSVREGANLRQAGESALELIADMDKPFVNQCRGAFYSAVLLGDYLEEDYSGLESRAKTYLTDAHNTAAGQCSLCALGAKGAEKAENYDFTAECCRNYFQFYKAHEEQEVSEQEQIIEESILLVKDAVTQEEADGMRLRWAQALVRLSRQEEFPGEQQEKLVQTVRQKMEGNGEFLFLPESIWEIASGGILPLEEMILELPLSQWMVMVIVLEAKKSLAEWEKLEKHLSSIRTQDDIRYDYLDMHYANALVSGQTLEKDYDDMCELLQYYTNSNLKYAGKVYTEKAFEGKMEMLPESCRGAVWMERMFACEAQAWNKKLEYLGKSAKEFPAIGETIKHFAKLIGEEQEKQAEQAKAANDELRAMAVQVKKQITVLMESGMYAEAMQVVKQMRRMLPEDKELIRLEKELGLKFS